MTDTSRVVYLDHAATSWPKPPGVVEAMTEAITERGANPGRSGHALALDSAKGVAEARAACASFLGVPDPNDLVFTPGATYGLNLMLKGSLEPGDLVLVSPMEHNAVTRVLTELQASRGIEVETLPASPSGVVDVDAAERMLKKRPVKAVVCLHASNVTGAVQPVADLADAAHASGALILVDGAQAGGHIELDLGALRADGYALSGHKALLGPQGVGLLYLDPRFTPVELVEGGTGSVSESPKQPSERPERYEAGTINAPGIAGLGAAVAWLAKDGHAGEVRARERRLARRLREGLEALPGLRVLGDPGDEAVPVVSVVPSGIGAHELAFELDRTYGIAVRAGLHCAPAAHRTLGSLETGAVRFGLGWSTTDAEVELALDAVGSVVASKGAAERA